MTAPKLSAIIGLYNQMNDRFMSGGYAPYRGLLEMIDIAGHQGLAKGIEFTHGEDGDLNSRNLAEVQARLTHYGMVISGINPNLWGQPRWGKGTLGANDASTRQQAIDYIKLVVDLAAEAGSSYVGLWPGQDGHDYYFEVDYGRVFDWWVSALQTLADHNPSMRLGIEFKPYEPRAYSFISTATKTLMLLDEVNRPNVGVCFDVGHSLYGGENLAEVVALCQRKGRLFHLHMNDNYGNWDWDLNVGSVHFLAYIEMMYWLRKTHYDGWYSMDIFSYRIDPTEAMAESLLWTQSLYNVIDRIGMTQLEALLAAGDANATSKFFREWMFRP
jgi:xylose isomerase